MFITGSSDGLGQLAAKALINLGHQVVLHARNEEQVWLAVSNDGDANVSGGYFHHKKQDRYLPAADATVQEKFLALCERITRVRFDK